MCVYSSCNIQLQHLQYLPCMSGDSHSRSPSIFSALLFTGGGAMEENLHHGFLDVWLYYSCIYTGLCPEKNSSRSLITSFKVVLSVSSYMVIVALNAR